MRVTLPMVSLIPESTLAGLREMFGARLDALIPPEVQSLATAAIEGAVSNARLQELLRAMAAPAASKGKAPASEVREVILKLCQGRCLQVETLAALLQRNARNLRHQYPAPMVREGLLKLRYPESPTRPDQAYTRGGGKA